MPAAYEWSDLDNEKTMYVAGEQESEREQTDGVNGKVASKTTMSERAWNQVCACVKEGVRVARKDGLGLWRQHAGVGGSKRTPRSGRRRECATCHQSGP
jgi:hypothetical protein